MPIKLDHDIPNIPYNDDTPTSPTKTNMEIGSTFKSQFNVIISEFKLNKETLQKEFMSKENKKDRIAFLKNYLKEERKTIRGNYFKTLEILQKKYIIFLMV